MKKQKDLLNNTCPVCGKLVEICTVYTRKQKFKDIKSVCIPCKEKEDKERLTQIGEEED